MQLTVPEAAQLLRVDDGTVFRWIRDRGLPATEFGGRFRINRVWLLEWAHDKGIALAVESDERMPRLSKALERGGQHLNIAGGDKSSVLRACVERLPLPSDADRGRLLEMLRLREELGSTGFGGGIALPHSRGPILLHVPEPLVALCHLAEPVDFGAHDGRPVVALFVQITPTVRVHLHLLAGIATALSDPEFSALVRERADLSRLIEWVERIEARPVNKSAAKIQA